MNPPARIAEETFLIPNIAPAGPAFIPVNSLVIRGAEPVIVDTGAPVHRAEWLEQVFSLVEPDDVRWVFLSHDDGDHLGNLQPVLNACPKATLIANFFITERMSLEEPLPLERMVWREPAERVDVGDRSLRLVLPPIFDAPTTRGILDESTGVMWTGDAFAAFTNDAAHLVEDVTTELFSESFTMLNSLVSPWHQWLDASLYRRHLDGLRSLEAAAVASAHGPVLRGSDIDTAYDQVRGMAGAPIIAPPGQPLLDEILAAATAATAS
jgi:flavorubredoxin